MADTVRTDAGLPFGELTVPGPAESESNGEVPAFTIGFGGVQHWVFTPDPPDEAP